MATTKLDKLSLKELVTFEAKIKPAIEVARLRKATEAEMAELAKTHGFSVSELFDDLKMARKKSVSVAKYANPADKSDAWTGRGRKPNWRVGRGDGVAMMRIPRGRR